MLFVMHENRVIVYVILQSVSLIVIALRAFGATQFN